MDDPRPPATSDPSRSGRLTRDEAAALLADADAALAAGDFRDAGVRYGRVIGFEDAERISGFSYAEMRNPATWRHIASRSAIWAARPSR